MSAGLARALTVLGAVVVLGSVNASIYGKERIIESGETIYLELAPVDPRSLMQGDYMALRFELAGEIERWRSSEGRESRRTAPLRVDERGVATLAGAGAGAGSGQGGEDSSLEIAFRLRGGEIWLGTNAYFFSEGTGDRYTSARYGEFRVDPDTGEAVLVGLRDAQLDPL